MLAMARLMASQSSCGGRKALRVLNLVASHSAPIRCLLVLTALWLLPTFASGAPVDDILKTAQVAGGLCVHLGCGDGSLSAEVAVQGKFIMHGLDADPAAIKSAQTMLMSKGLYGQVSVEHWTATTLPYADDVVNLIIVDKPGQVPLDEINRVVCPGGVVLLRENGKWVRTVKARPGDMDEWTHWRHGPDRNPVSKDKIVEVPKRIQWLSTHGAEGKEMVSAGGRNFYSIANILLARDAFNGLVLWSRKLGKFDGKSSPVAFGNDLFGIFDGKLICLDAATGKEKRRYPEAATPTTILRLDDSRDSGGLLIAATTDFVCALAVESGKVLWKFNATSPRALSSTNGKLFLITGDPKGGRAKRRQRLRCQNRQGPMGKERNRLGQVVLSFGLWRRHRDF